MVEDKVEKGNVCSSDFSQEARLNIDASGMIRQVSLCRGHIGLEAQIGI